MQDEDLNVPIVIEGIDLYSYLAGFQMGELKGMLDSGNISAMAWTVTAANLRQADLIAMALGYTLIPHEQQGEMITIEIRKGTGLE